MSQLSQVSTHDVPAKPAMNPVYRKRLLMHRIGIALSVAAMALGLAVLVWILFTLVIKGFGALSIDLFTQTTPAPGSEGGGRLRIHRQHAVQRHRHENTAILVRLGRRARIGNIVAVGMRVPGAHFDAGLEAALEFHAYTAVFCQEAAGARRYRDVMRQAIVQRADRRDRLVVATVKQPFVTALLQCIDGQVRSPAAVFWQIQHLSAGATEHVFVQTGRHAGIYAFGRVVVFVQQDAAEREPPATQVFRHVAAYVRQVTVGRLLDARYGFQQLQAGRAIQIQAIAKALVIIGHRRDGITEGATRIIEEETDLGCNLEAVRFAIQ